MAERDISMFRRRALRRSCLGVIACALLAIAAVGPVAWAQDLAAARAAFEREDYVTAFPLYERAAATHPEAQYRLGLMLKFGWGADKDLAAAARWLRRAAEQSHGEAQAELGVLYRDGRGVDEDPVQAVLWWRRAANAGVGIAQLNLARAYRDGKGIGRDLVESYAWFTVAAANGYMDGLSNRTRVAEDMNEQQVARAEKLASERRPATTTKEGK